MTTKVTIRQKKISRGRHSLYLDFYPAIETSVPGKKTRREFLGKFIYDTPRTTEEKQNNKDAWQFAEASEQKWKEELNGNALLNDYQKKMIQQDKEEKRIGELSFLDYFLKLGDKRQGSAGVGWKSAYNYLRDFTGGELKFKDLNVRVCNDFRDYLINIKNPKTEKPLLSQNSAYLYFCKFKAALRQAYKDGQGVKYEKEPNKDGYLLTDLNILIDPIDKKETRRNYLTLIELNKLIKTPCNNVVLKRAALFSALTGLRHSDITKLVWGEIDFIEGEGYYIDFTQQKTNGLEHMPISEQAYSLLGQRGEPTERVFRGLVYSVHSNKDLAKWIGLAGISKDVTFHGFRHSFAMLLLDKKVDIFTISKMLGHRDLKTTEIYAKIKDEAKRKASNAITLDL
jgi:integrase